MLTKSVVIEKVLKSDKNKFKIYHEIIQNQMIN